MFSLNALSGGGDKIMMHVKGEDNPPFHNRRKKSTIIQAMTEVTEADFDNLMSFTESVKLHVISNDHSVGTAAPLCIKALKDRFGEDKNWDKLQSFEKAVTDGGTIIACSPNPDGSMSAYEDRQLTTDDDSSQSSENEDVQDNIADVDLSSFDMGTEDPEEIIKLIEFLDKCVVYEGFKPSLIRNNLYENFKDDSQKHEFAKTLTILFVAYCAIGNNKTKLTKKRHNADWAKEVLGVVDKLKISKKARNKQILTLPRIAIAFMPELLIYRKFISQELQEQTSSTISKIYQDLAFKGCPQISAITGYAEFHKEMSSYIYKPSEDTDLNDEKFLKNYNRWNKIATKGYASDKKMHKRMEKALSFVSMSPREAYEFIASSHDDKIYISK